MAYYEEFVDGGAHCFGCHYHVEEGGGSITAGGRPGPTFTSTHLEPDDYFRLLRWWGIGPILANEYGLAIAEGSDGSRWVDIPIFDWRQRAIYHQFRAWNTLCWRKYLARSLPPGGAVWRSWFGRSRPSILVIVEGAFDGMRVAEAGYPTVALLGADANEAQIEAIHQLAAPEAVFCILLDGDVLHKAHKLAAALGLLRSRIVVLPESRDPADYDREVLVSMLKPYVGGV